MAVDALISGGRLAAFARGRDGSLGRAWQAAPNGQWSSWADLGPAIGGAPAVAQNADGHLDVFAIGADGRLGNMWQESGVGGFWSEWSDLGPRLRGDPVVFRNAEARLELFAVGPDGKLGHMWQLPPDLGGWSHWEGLGPTIRGIPTVFQNADGRLELFASGPDGLLGHVWQQAGDLGGWSDWADLGPAISGDPVVFRNADGRLELFAAGPDGALGHMWQLEPSGHAGWSEWLELGPAVSGPPAVFPNADGHLELFASGPDGKLGHMWQLEPDGHGGWSDWVKLETSSSGAPAVFQNADGRLELFATGPDGKLGHMWQVKPNGAGGWSDWVELGPAISAGRVAVCQCDDRGLVDLELLREVERRASSGWTLGQPGVIGADVCVVGAGPAGISLSHDLLRAGASVILVESGGWESDPITEELNRGLADGPLVKGYSRYLTDGRARQVQGAASRWGPGWIMPFRTIDFEKRPWVPRSGWPISPAELAPYETQASATFGFDAFGAPRSDGALMRVAYQFPPEPQVFRVRFLELLTRPRFRAEFGATAVALDVREDRIEAVRCARVAGGELRVTAGTVVLACGGVENARFLLLNEEVLPLRNEMTGRCFMEHPHLLAGGAWVPDAESMRPFFRASPFRDVLALGDGVQRDERLLNASVELRLAGRRDTVEGFAECELYVRAEQAPNPDSRLVLGERLDRFRRRQPVLDWQVLEQDWDSIFRTVGLVAAALEDQLGASVGLAIAEDQPWPGDPGGPDHSQHGTWGYHHMGTTRMSDTAADGVVDRNCLVHGTSNLYLAGSSVFPTGSCANPTFTIVALAHRLADHISAQP